MAESDPALGRTRNPIRDWWNAHVIATVAHREVIERVHDDSGWSNHFAFMTLMSAGIAVLGLLLSSPAVVIGAMLISPLMGPIIGLGFALAVFDSYEMRRSASALGLGILLAVLFCALIVLFSPLQTVTEEIAARTRPNLFDLLVALFSALAGTYAMIRGRHGTIVGVAIATALMPPLAVMGYGLATLNMTVLGGSTLLFFTNLMTIAVGAAVLARLYGFAGDLSPRQTGLQALLVLGTILALAVPLGLSLRQIAWEALATRESRAAIARNFPAEARISALDIDYDAEPLSIRAAVLTPAYAPGVERDIDAVLTAVFKRPVDVTIAQSLAGNGQASTEAAELARARRSTEDLQTAEITQRLSLVAGVAADNILVDSGRHRALVTAAPLPGATFATYRALEARVSALEGNWEVTLKPPLRDLPALPLVEGEPDPDALATAVWAAQRLELPVEISGPAQAAETARAAFEEAGVTATVEGEGTGGAISLDWAAPPAQ